MVPPGPDTTSGHGGAQGDAPPVAAALSAVGHEIVAPAGLDRSGRSVFVAREKSPSDAPATPGGGRLMVVFAETPHTNAPALGTLWLLDREAIALPGECYVCAAPRLDDARFCQACGATMSINVPGLTPAAAASGIEAVSTAMGDQFAVVGQIPTTAGQGIYFARERHTQSMLLAFIQRPATANDAGSHTPVLDVMPAIDAIQPSLPPVAQSSVEDAAPVVPVLAGDADDPLIGTLLDGKYRVLRKLGQGGMGRVFDARHEQLRARRAIKVMHPHLQSRTDLVTRFYEEARNAERVKHEHVCTVHDFGTSDGLTYIAMEFVDGEPLSALLKREGKVAPARVGVIIAQTAAALDAAHALKIIHRDVKPDNIMLCRRDDGRDDVKVVDFGISKAINRSELTHSGEQTQHGVVIGTVDYMSEEQRMGQEIDIRTDVYALGRTAVKMLFGELPEHTAWKEWSRTRVNPPVERVLSRALAPRAERYATAGEFSRDLTRVLRTASPERASGWRSQMQQLTHALTSVQQRPGIAFAVLGAIAVLAAAPFVARSFAGRTDTTVIPPTGAAAIEASPSALSFETEAGVTIPARQEVQIKSLSGKEVDGLGINEIEYDGQATDWLARPTWRDGNAATPTTLVLEPRVGSTPPGSYTARVRVVSTSSGQPTALITATLVVKGADKCLASQARLAQIRKLTDPVSGTTRDAQQVVALVPPLQASLCSAKDQVEAQLRLAEAHMVLSQTERACEVLRGIEQKSASTPFAANVRTYLSQCP